VVRTSRNCLACVTAPLSASVFAPRVSLRKDPTFAVEYLNDVLEDGDEKELMVALRRVADAFGGVPKLAEKTKLNATTLYRTLSRKGNPELRSMTSMLKAMGLRLAVQPISKSA